MRGSCLLLLRIIPARAGFTVVTSVSTATAEDHPRSRGVYRGPRGPVRRAAGSSPLARGLPGTQCCRRHPERIIPARAGFTLRPSPTRKPGPDHPRSRGVYRTWRPGTPKRPGSSPLARGLPEQMIEQFRKYGIIPARAGFTRSGAATPSRAADHPRSRGVYPCRVDGQGAARGSSPLARGLHRRTPTLLSHPGIIPARAGFTAHRRPRGRPLRDHPRSRGVY